MGGHTGIDHKGGNHGGQSPLASPVEDDEGQSQAHTGAVDKGQKGLGIVGTFPLGEFSRYRFASHQEDCEGNEKDQ